MAGIAAAGAVAIGVIAVCLRGGAARVADHAVERHSEPCPELVERREPPRHDPPTVAFFVADGAQPVPGGVGFSEATPGSSRGTKCQLDGGGATTPGNSTPRSSSTTKCH